MVSNCLEPKTFKGVKVAAMREKKKGQLTLIIMILVWRFAIQHLVDLDNICVGFITAELVVRTIEAEY